MRKLGKLWGNAHGEMSVHSSEKIYSPTVHKMLNLILLTIKTFSRKGYMGLKRKTLNIYRGPRELKMKHVRLNRYSVLLED